MPRTAAQYLSDHSNDAEAALAAAVADVNAAHGENAVASFCVGDSKKW